MKRFVNIIILVTLLFGCYSSGNNKPTVVVNEKDTTQNKVVKETKLDTVVTLCLVLTNVEQGESKTMWLTKVMGTVYDFKQPTAEQLKDTTVVIKKEFIEVKKYFTVVRDTKNQSNETEKQPQLAEVNQSYILIDFNSNIPRNK